VFCVSAFELIIRTIDFEVSAMKYVVSIVALTAVSLLTSLPAMAQISGSFGNGQVQIEFGRRHHRHHGHDGHHRRSTVIYSPGVVQYPQPVGGHYSTVYQVPTVLYSQTQIRTGNVTTTFTDPQYVIQPQIIQPSYPGPTIIIAPPAPYQYRRYDQPTLSIDPPRSPLDNAGYSPMGQFR
jgi:hypothetical protein